jgi:hypothetical protein
MGMALVVLLAGSLPAAEQEVAIPLAAPDKAIGFSLTLGGNPSTRIVLDGDQGRGVTSTAGG